MKDSHEKRDCDRGKRGKEAKTFMGLCGNTYKMYLRVCWYSERIYVDWEVCWPKSDTVDGISFLEFFYNELMADYTG